MTPKYSIAKAFIGDFGYSGGMQILPPHQRPSIPPPAKNTKARSLERQFPKAFYVCQNEFSKCIKTNKITLPDLKAMPVNDLLIMSQIRLATFKDDYVTGHLPTVDKLVVSIVESVAALEKILTENKI